MSVPIQMVDVIMIVRTLLVAIIVCVKVDMYLEQIDTVVKVVTEQLATELNEFMYQHYMLYRCQ